MNWDLLFTHLAAAVLPLAAYIDLSKRFSGRKRDRIKGVEGKHGPKSYKFDRVQREEVIGLDNIIDEVETWLYALNNLSKLPPQLDLPRGALFLGDGGVGKTLTARYMFSQAEGEVWQPKAKNDSSYIDTTLYFKAARHRREKTGKGVILFIDEFDKKRVQMAGLQEELSGINSDRNRGIFVLATANRLPTYNEMGLEFDLRKESMYRPGRLKIVRFGYPNLQSKNGILELYLGKMDITERIDTKAISAMLPIECSGAHIKDLVNWALIIKSEYGSSGELSNTDLIQAMRQAIIGTVQETFAGPKQKKQHAIHEAGHYVVAERLKYQIPFVSIEPTFTTAGQTYTAPEPDELWATTETIEKRIQISMAGYLAEEEFGYQKTTGSTSDMQAIHHFFAIRRGLENKHLDPRRFTGTAQVQDYQDLKENDYTGFEKQARDIVTESRKRIEEIATILEDKLTLTAYDIKSIGK